jgi:hypothetical protein
MVGAIAPYRFKTRSDRFVELTLMVKDRELNNLCNDFASLTGRARCPPHKIFGY